MHSAHVKCEDGRAAVASNEQPGAGGGGHPGARDRAAGRVLLQRGRAAELRARHQLRRPRRPGGARHDSGKIDISIITVGSP